MKPLNRAGDRQAERSTATSRKSERNVLVLAMHRKALFKLQAAGTIERYWTAAQALTEASAPCSTRWFCVRPIQMAGALMLLRETAGARGRARPREQEEETAQLRDLFAQHPAMLHFRRNSRASLVHLNPETTAWSKPARDWLHQRNWKFGVALAFWRRNRIEGFLLLHRTADEDDFSKMELASLRELHPQLQTALIRLIAARKQQAQKTSVAGILRGLPWPLVLCDSRLRIVCESAAGLAARVGWEIGAERARVEKHPSRRPLPHDLARFCHARIDEWEKAQPRQRARLEKEECAFEHASAMPLRAKVRMIRPMAFPLVRPQLLIQFESAAAPDTASNGSQRLKGNFDVLSRLSPRERELALLVSEGHGNERIARELGKSLHTVKAQLGSIFAKLQVKSRSQLAARVTRVGMCLLSILSNEIVWGLFGAEDLVPSLI